MITRFLYIALFVFPWISYGQSSYAPFLERACLDRVTSELTLLLKPGKDTCSPFKKYQLWGRTDLFAEFELLDQTTTFNLLSWNCNLPNKKSWELYISAHYSCGNNDSFLSNVVFIDDTPPSYVEPDSISVSFDSQKIIAGWSNPPETDVLGYSLFRVDGSGNNLLIDEQNVLFYTFDPSDFKANQGGNKLAIAAYDSCRNGGVISSFHSPVLASVKTNANYLCDKGIQIDWSPYVGWDVEKYEVFIRDSEKNNTIQKITVSGAQTSCTFTLPYLNVKLDVFVRAFKTFSSISSTSNRVDLFVSDFPKPSTETSLYFCSVKDNFEIELEGFVNPNDSLVLYYKTSATSWLPTLTNPSSNGTFLYKHPHNDTRIQPVDFLLVRHNTCKKPADSTTIIRTIHLQNNNRSISWNENEQWSFLGGASEYIIEQNKTGIWKELDRTRGLTYELPPFGSYQVRIKGETDLWSIQNRGYSYSNAIWVDLGFDSSLIDTLLIPNAFSPEGNNPVFKITNPAIQMGESTMYIYNRWGEKVFQGDALLGWDGSITGEPALDGLYIYRVTALYREKRVERNGTVLLLR